MDLNHLTKSQIPIFSNSKSFTVKSQIESQIFHKNKYAKRFSIDSRDPMFDTVYFRPNRT